SIRVITENIRSEGRIEGRVEGRAEGKLETVLSLFRKGKLNASDAAEEAGMSVKQFLAKAKMS
ncbi:MAG: hypothetical protein ACI32N_10750, partial [Bulleidia sp.]